MKVKQILEKKESPAEQRANKLGITKSGGPGVGLNEKKGIWYGWSHRAIAGFKIGDKVFEANFGDDSTPFKQHGSKTIKTLDDAKLAAKRFADYVS